MLINSQDSIEDHKLLPSGRLREPWNNIKRADAIIMTKVNWNTKNKFLRKKVKKTETPILESYSKVTISKLFNKKIINSNYKRAYLVSGIGDTKSFHFATKNMGFIICGYSTFSDHFHFSQKNINQILKNTKDLNADVILTTEKDWIKLQEIEIDFPVLVIELNITVEPQNQLNDLLNSIIK